MPDLEKLANMITEQLGDLAIDSSRCVRVRSPRLGRCDDCIKICPEDSIKFTEDGLVLNNCTNCGLCASVCPTGALSSQNPSLISLINNLEERVNMYQEAYICCSEIGSKVEAHLLQVSCLGAIPIEGWLFIGNLEGKVKVLPPKSRCQSCSKHAGEKWSLILKEAEDLLASQIVFASSVKSPKRKKKQGFSRERRNFFGAMLGGLGRAPEKIASELLGREETKKIQPNISLMTDKRQAQFRLVRLKSELKEKITVSQPKAMGNCRFCKACETLCPQGAIKQIEAGEKVELLLDPSTCSGCDLCAHICFHEALAMEEMLFEAAAAPQKILATGSTYRCQKCGNDYQAVNEGCVFCEDKFSGF